jgi:tol-pal system protein YbgF
MKRMLAAFAVVVMAVGAATGATQIEATGFDTGQRANAGGALLPARNLALREPVRIAQVADAAFRINQLEEQVRSLNGKIEELNFIILQLQEELRKMQEDNEFRFQEIEQRSGIEPKSGGSAVGGIRRQSGAEEGTAPPQQQVAPENQAAAGGQAIEEQDTVRTIDGVEIFEDKPGQQESGEPQPLGKLVFDGNGNLIDSSIEKPLDLTKPPGSQDQIGTVLQQQQQQAALGPDPAQAADQAYDLGYTYLQAGDYRHAANSFREFVRDYPKHAKIAEARFWLGESLLAMKKYDEAAKVLLETHKQYPNARLAPQTLLKLGVSLAGMNQRELACATFAEVYKKYPKASESVRAKVAAEQKAANCTAG